MLIVLSYVSFNLGSADGIKKLLETNNNSSSSRYVYIVKIQCLSYREKAQTKLFNWLNGFDVTHL